MRRDWEACCRDLRGRDDHDDRRGSAAKGATMTTKSGVKATGASASKAQGAKKPAGTSTSAKKPATSTREPAAGKRAPKASTPRATGAAATKSATKPSTRPAGAKPATQSAATGRKTRSAAETEKIRTALGARLSELRTEYDRTIAQLTDLQRDRLTDSAGDDQADTGTKTFEREQEISLANGIRDRITQVERALERLDGGHYGYCERCGNPIPAERLAAFPSATLCVTWKQLEERR
jgi:RNA polymerase-binding protein DksA